MGLITNCKGTYKDAPACYVLPNMKEVRANFLWETKQHDRLSELRRKVYNSGRSLDYIAPLGFKYKWRLY